MSPGFCLWHPNYCSIERALGRERDGQPEARIEAVGKPRRGRKPLGIGVPAKPLGIVIGVMHNESTRNSPPVHDQHLMRQIQI